ncbi:hypothetical protein EVAR_2288_1 [Eumeta japonica]|uniref:Uncharacterized protein n=1 Tax=Eumeta variegata TaxID=151549 RepID=A0A4C1SGI8_EUMVA|nr:hypothetical protein EVAR_2288_1 [Eumeta japonica]
MVTFKPDVILVLIGTVVSSRGQLKAETLYQHDPTNERRTPDAPQSPCGCRVLNIPAIVLFCQTAGGCRGGWSHFGIEAVREECCWRSDDVCDAAFEL